jgi:uncharacterized protein (TIGR02145 family)
VDDSEFTFLDRANGGTGANNQSGISYTGFWKPTSATTVISTDPFKSLYSGYVNSSGTLYYQGSDGYWWSASEVSAPVAYYLRVNTGGVNPQDNNTGKYNGFAVRCIKD